MTPELNPKALYEFEVPAASDAVAQILSPYDMLLSVGNCQFFIGRFSHSLMSRIRVLRLPDAGRLVSIGAFCEATDDAQILVGGEHRNESVLNLSMASIGSLHSFFMSKADAKHFECDPIETIIGDNVLISTRVTILEGAKIGAGSVIAAGAIVRGDLGPLGIYGGVPARRLKDRLTPDRAKAYGRLNLPMIRAHCLPLLSRCAARLENGEPFDDAVAGLEWMARRPMIRAVATIEEGRLKLKNLEGFCIGEEHITAAPLVEKLREYFAQALQRGASFRWSPDLFYMLGIE